jgi:hypothetical protein
MCYESGKQKSISSEDNSNMLKLPGNMANIMDMIIPEVRNKESERNPFSGALANITSLSCPTQYHNHNYDCTEHDSFKIIHVYILLPYLRQAQPLKSILRRLHQRCLPAQQPHNLHHLRLPNLRRHLEILWRRHSLAVHF